MHTVVHSVGLLFATVFLVLTLWVGYDLYRNESFVKTLDDDNSHQLTSNGYTPLFAIFGTVTAISFAISGPQSYGAYLLLKSTNMNTIGSEAVMKVNSFRKIQLVFLSIDLGIIIPPILMDFDDLFAFPILFMLTLFVFHYISVHAVDWFGSELKIATAEEFKEVEKQKRLGESSSGAVCHIHLHD
ncbi:unnamed protein product [Orchesella dallaii]|uniref:Uncharacterized protein n=1 Tax=Orchesella dallaii TaxID=48710 RepID=A0ABP1RH56_9HEXA